MNLLVLPDLVAAAGALRADSDWVSFRPGVTAHWLYNEGAGGRVRGTAAL